MRRSLSKTLIVVISGFGLLVGSYYLWVLQDVLVDPVYPVVEAKDSEAPKHSSHSSGGEDPLEAREPAANDEGENVVSLDEIISNIDAEKPYRPNHSVGIKLDLELFEESGKDIIETAKGKVRDTIIGVAREQEFESISTLPGKLYFKEQLIDNINRGLGKAVVRDIHFYSFYIE